jgi:sugar lactone lactonase YvrE
MPATPATPDTPAGAPQILASGLVMGECPRWHDGRLWLADWVPHEIITVGLDGKTKVVARVGSLPLSFDWLPDGRMLVVSSDDRQVLRQEADGTFAVHADLRAIADFPWNEIVVDGWGNAYVNTIGFELMGGAEPAPGLVAVVSPDGSARAVGDGVMFPNGMAVTPDGATLIVAESYGHRLTAFTIGADGGLSGRRVWADLGEGTPDGICLDAEGAAWYADVPNRRCVRVREGGEVLQTVAADRGCFACMLGGDDGRTLFVVAAEWGGVEGVGGEPTGQVLTARAPAPHAGRP